MKRLLVLLLVVAAMVLAAISPRGVEARKQFADNRACCDLSIAQAFSPYVPSNPRRPLLPFRDRPGQMGDLPDVSGRQERLLPRRRIRPRHDRLEYQGARGTGLDRHLRRSVSDAYGGPHLPDGKSGGVERVGTGRQVPHAFRARRHRRHARQVEGRSRKESRRRAETITLGELLDRAHAPAFIHFLSVDIEGAELEALKGIPFDKYRFGSMAIEHNEEEPKRTDILKFLAAHGYQRVHSYKQDDFYAPR